MNPLLQFTVLGQAGWKEFAVAGTSLVYVLPPTKRSPLPSPALPLAGAQRREERLRREAEQIRAVIYRRFGPPGA
jgi:hypothetical protein